MLVNARVAMDLRDERDYGARKRSRRRS